MVSYVKRPGFEREPAPATPIEGAELDADGNLLVRVTNEYPADPSKTEEQYMARELQMLEVLKIIRAEMARMNFMMSAMTGIELEMEDFEDV